MTADVDAVIAGGGIAGSAAAAALGDLGWSVLIVEPGQHAERRLAGELIHPAGVAALASLGLPEASFPQAERLGGFTVFPGIGGHGGIDLPYQAKGVALALDHPAIGRTLLAGALARPGVQLAQGSRVCGLTGIDSAPAVTIRQGGRTQTVRCRLVVAADGASSAVRFQAGLRHTRVRTATLTGFKIPAEYLPLRERGLVFTACGGPVLAYPIGHGQARVLFNRRLDRAPADDRALPGLAALPHALRGAVQRQAALSAGQRFVSSTVRVSGGSRGRVVLVGDAAGSCHPITASGMTMGIEDAIRLARALRTCGGNIDAVLAGFARERRARQRARVLLASMLHEVLAGESPAMGVLRVAMARYWLGSARARRASMALLGMDDLSSAAILHEVFRMLLSGAFGGRAQLLAST